MNKNHTFNSKDVPLKLKTNAFTLFQFLAVPIKEIIHF